MGCFSAVYCNIELTVFTAKKVMMRNLSTGFGFGETCSGIKLSLLRIQNFGALGVSCCPIEISVLYTNHCLSHFVYAFFFFQVMK